MPQSAVIVGAGITGLTCAYVLNFFNPKLSITLIDAGPEPQFAPENTFLKGHSGATLGHGRDSRHFTGTEGLSFQNPVHTKLLYESASEKSAGWRTIPEKELTTREKRWRQECVSRYQQHVTPNYNPYDEMYAALNYGGMEAWTFLASLDDELAKFRISSNYVYVAFEDEQAMRADFDSESHFNPFNSDGKSRVLLAETDVLHDRLAKALAIDKIYPKLLRVPGTSWRIQSAWKHFYGLLREKSNVTFKWDSQIAKAKDLPTASDYVWAAGSTHTAPDIYKEHGRVQGIGGWWLSIPNQGFKAPFKISAPQPSGYINFTPDGKFLHISGGFGWVGEREFQEACELLKPTEEHFLEHLSLFLKIPKATLKGYGTGCCIRPTTPTGLPDVKALSYGGRKHIMVSGAGKAGATQAPLLALHVARSLGLDVNNRLQAYKEHSAESGKVIERGLQLLDRGFEPDEGRDV